MEKTVFTYFDIIKLPFVHNSKINKWAFPIYIVLFHAILMIVVYLSSPIVVVMRYILTGITALTIELTIFFYVQSNKALQIDSYEKLYSQLSSEEKKAVKATFSDWYFDKHLIRMYGHIKQQNNHKLSIEVRKELPFWAAQLVFTLIWLTFAVCFPYQKQQCKWFYIAHISNSIIYWVVISYILRIIISSVFITHDYEKWNLSPPISRYNNAGFDSLVNMWNKTIAYFIPFWFLFWLYTALVYEHTLELDIIYVISAVFLVCLWSITTSTRTLFLAKKVRLKAMNEYEHTIIEKNDVFRDSPSQSALYDLQQSIKVLNEYEKTVYSEFTRKSYILSIFLNIWVFLLPAIYIVVYLC